MERVNLLVRIRMGSPVDWGGDMSSRQRTTGHSGKEIEVRVLGPQMILRNGVEVPPPAPQQRRVLAVLASRPGEVVAREAISQAIWGSSTAQQLRSLQSYVSHLRTILGTDAIELVGGGYRLNVVASQIDEMQFRSHVERGLARVSDGRFREARVYLESAIGLYRGKPYDDLPNGQFAVRRTGLLQLRDAAEDALLRMRVDLVRTSQDCDSLVPVLAQAYVDHPDRELRALLYARTLAMAGRLQEAAEIARQFRVRLKEQTGAEPSAAFTETVALLAQQDRAALSRAWDSVVDVPLYAGPLLGRDLEVKAAATMLEVGASTLVTITGVSGVGKTRVAASVARVLADDLPGGVIWVDASSAATGSELLDCIAAAVRWRGPGIGLRQHMVKVLGERRTLVVIDGLESIDAKAALAVVLGAGPRVCLIATSPERVGLASEQVLRLQPFSTSGGATSPAVGFVVAMLGLLAPDFTVDREAIAAAVAATSGAPAALEQVALDAITGASRFGRHVDVLPGNLTA